MMSLNPRMAQLYGARKENEEDETAFRVGSFFRGVTSGITDLYKEDLPFIEDEPEKDKGLLNVASKFAGRVAGSAVTIAALESGIVAPLLGAIAPSFAAGPLGGLVGGAIALTAYTLAENADLKTKVIDTAIGLVGAGVFGKIKLKQIKNMKADLDKASYEMVKSTKAEGLLKNQKLSQVVDEVDVLEKQKQSIREALKVSTEKDKLQLQIDDIDSLINKKKTSFEKYYNEDPILGGDVLGSKQDMVEYAIKHDMDPDFKNSPEIVKRMQLDFFKDPKTMAANYPNFMKSFKSTLFDDKGFIRKDVSAVLQDASGQSAKLMNSLIMQEAARVGDSLANNWTKKFMGPLRKTKEAISNQLSSPGNILGKRPGGGLIHEHADEAYQAMGTLEGRGLNHIESFDIRVEKMKSNTPSAYAELSQRVALALDDPTNAKQYLKDSDLGYEMFEGYRGGFAEAGGWARSIGVKTRGDYDFAHIKRTLKNPKGELGMQVHADLADAFFKPRTGALTDYIKDDIHKVYKTYIHWSAKRVAFDKTVKEWDALGRDKIIGAFLNKVTKERRVPGGLIDSIAHMKYVSHLKYNFFGAASNRSQVFSAYARISPEARNLARQIAKIDDPNINKFLNGKFTHYAESMGIEELVPKVDNLNKFLNKAAVFETSEGINWLDSRSAGLAEEIVRHPQYSKLLQEATPKGLFGNISARWGTVDSMQSAIKTILKDNTVWERGIQRGSALGKTTQFPMAQGFRSELYELLTSNPVTRLPLQFTRFAFSNAEQAFNLVFKGLKGREVEIAARGLGDEVAVVRRLQSMEMISRGAKRMLSSTKGTKTHEMLTDIIKEAKTDMGFLRNEVKRIEPRDALRSVMAMTNMVAYGAMPKLARTWLKWGLLGLAFNKTFNTKEKEKQVASVVRSQVPGLEFARGMDINPGKYSEPFTAYNFASFGVSMMPGLGVIDSLMPGRPFTRVLQRTLQGKPIREKDKPVKKNIQKKRKTVPYSYYD